MLSQLLEVSTLKADDYGWNLSMVKCTAVFCGCYVMPLVSIIFISLVISYIQGFMPFIATRGVIMLRKVIKTIIGWFKELWELLKVISDIAPVQQSTLHRNQTTSSNTRLNALHDHRSSERLPEVARHRYVEVDGYAENFRIDRLGRYDLLQIERFCENFVFVGSDAIDDFVDATINYAKSYVDDDDVLWVPKGDCIEFAYHHHPGLADVL